MNYYNTDKDFLGVKEKNDQDVNAKNDQGKDTDKENKVSGIDDMDDTYYDMNSLPVVIAVSEDDENRFAQICTTRAFLYLSLGIFISWISAELTHIILSIKNDDLMGFVVAAVFFGKIIVFVLAYNFLNENESKKNWIYFILYAIFSGAFNAYLCKLLTTAKIIHVFLIEASVCGIVFVVCKLTKKSINMFIQIIIMLITAVLLETAVHFITGNSLLASEWSMIIVLIFTGFTVYKTRKVKVRAHTCLGEEQIDSVSIACALELYIELLSVFVKLLIAIGNFGEGDGRRKNRRWKNY